VVAADLRRYLPLVWLLSWLRAGVGLALLALDLAAGMPAWWVAAEGPAVLVLSAAGLLLVRQVGRERGA
jgi:hypothetical protein